MISHLMESCLPVVGTIKRWVKMLSLCCFNCSISMSQYPIWNCFIYLIFFFFWKSLTFTFTERSSNFMASLRFDYLRLKCLIQVALWYTDTLEPKARLLEHSSLITDVRFSPRLPYVSTSSFDKTVRLWDANNVISH